MNRSNIAARLRALGLQAGFDQVGVGSVRETAHRGAVIDWLERGFQASMEYLARNVDKRLDARKLLPNCRSVLCVGLQYHPLVGEPEAGGDLWSRVARYARGVDYHDLMKKKLRLLASEIEAEFPGVATRPYVDTGPVLEREVAAAAGLGAVGKNTLLLSSDRGSWNLLGEIFLDLEVEPDLPVEDLCGSCTACLDACPTGAIVQPYVLDSRRCISYWTIESRGAWPVEARELVDDWVFGCDVCQEVCPANSVVAPVEHPEFRLDPARAGLDLAALLNIRRDEYVVAFRGSPMKRAKQEGLARNAATAMGNLGDERYVEALETGLDNDSEVVARHSAWALGRIGGQRSRQVLERRLEIEERDEVRGEIMQALSGL